MRNIGEAARQVALADRLAITKSDLLDAADRPARLARPARKRCARSIRARRMVDIAAGEFGAADLIALDPLDVASAA